MVLQIRNSNTITMVQPERRRLVTGMTPGCGWLQLLPLLEQAGFILPDQADQRSPEEWLRDFPGVSLLLFHARPEALLTDAMRNNQSPVEALAQWREAANQLLVTFRHHRNRIALVDVDTALASPTLFLRACHEHLGMNISYFGDLSILEDAQAADDLEDIYHMIAAQMTYQAPNINALLMQLEVCSLPIGEPSSPLAVDCEKVYREYLSLKAEIVLDHHQQAEKNAQLANLQTRLDEITAESNEKNRIFDGLQIQLRQTGREYEHISGQLRSTEECLTDLRTKNELILHQLDKARKELEEALLKQQKLIKEKDELIAEHDQVRSQYEQFVRQHDQEIADRETKLTRLQMTHQEVESAFRESTQENELLLRQLHQVQEELESNYLQMQSCKEMLHKAEKKQENMERIISNRNRRIRYFESSKSWKITAPLRAIMGVFVKRPERTESHQA